MTLEARRELPPTFSFLITEYENDWVVSMPVSLTDLPLRGGWALVELEG